MIDTATRAGLSAYVPRWVVDETVANTAESPSPTAKTMDAIIAIADVSGFTALGERLAKRGPEGAEELWRIVNGLFARLEEDIQRYGGDVLRYAGDAPVILWRADTTSPETAAHRAVACCAALQESVRAFRTAGGLKLGLRVGVSFGRVTAARVGGVEGRWEHFVGGQAFDRLPPTLHAARKHDIIVDSRVASLLGTRATTASLDDGMRRIQTCEPTGEAPLLRESVEGKDAQLRRFVPKGVLERLDAGHGSWIAELRQVTVLFASVEGIQLASDEGTATLNAACKALQTAVYDVQGQVNQFLADDKGTVLVAAWGLPGTTHEDDPARAVHAGQSILKALDALGLTGSIGITTGRVFCGRRGGVLRQEYGLLGSVVNLAARLMGRSNGGVLCDAATAMPAKARFELVEQPAIRVKGRAEPLPVFGFKGRPAAQAASETLVGRKKELDTLRAALQHAGSASATVLIEADAGLGKTRLLDAAVAHLREAGHAVHRGTGDAIESRTPLFAFRPILSGILGLSDEGSAQERSADAEDWFLEHPELADTASLLNHLLGLNLVETAAARDTEGKGRAESMMKLCMRMIETLDPPILALDDLQWADSASWQLLHECLQVLPNATVLLASRPPELPATDAESRLRELPGLQRLNLDNLNRSEMAQLVARELKVAELPAAVEEVIWRRCEGHPFFAGELTHAMRDAGLIEVAQGECRITAAGGDLTDVALPDTLQGIITSRLDRLGAAEQMCLKAASVIGRHFGARMLTDVFPIRDAASQVEHDLETLTSLDLTVLEAPAPDASYLFRHALTQEVAYGLLLYEQRRGLHRAIAEWFEEAYDGALEPHYALLAHHWTQALDRPDKTLNATEAAGLQALGNFANEEAIAFLTQAIDIANSGRVPPVDKMRRARWARALGEANLRLGRLEEARTHLSRASNLMGHTPPSGTFAVVTGLLYQTMVQVWRRFVWAPKPVLEDRERITEAANNYSELGMAAYFEGDSLKLLYCYLRGLNIAERAGESPDLARLQAALGAIVAGMPLPGAADWYGLEAIRIANRFEDVQARAVTRHWRGAYLCGIGRWSEGEEHFDHALEGYSRAGDGRKAAEVVHCMVHVNMNRGDYYEAENLLNTLADSSRRRKDEQGAFWVDACRLEMLVRAGRFDDASAFIDSIDQSRQHEELFLTRYRGLCLKVYIAIGELDRAVEAAKELSGMATGASFVEAEAFAGEAVVAIAALERLGESGARKRAALKACKALHKYSNTFAQASQRAWYQQGRLEAILGNTAEAKKAWQKSLEISVDQESVYDIERAARALASVSTGTERDGYNAQADKAQDSVIPMTTSGVPRSVSPT
ncbi:MAG: AAA family ATPase [Proteobacteria bacterium]|nr:AAA family ATPase [Pseudomonadota bacterium]